MHLRILPDHQNIGLKKLIFYVWSGSNRVLMHLRILPEHHNHGLKKIFRSEVVKKVFWCICAYFQTKRIMAWKNIFLMSEVAQNVFWCICTYFQTTRIMAWKKYILGLNWLKRCFDAFAHTTRPPESWPEKWIFFVSKKLQNVFWCICAYFQITRIMAWKKIFF
jgi:hypothetical protein